MIDPDEISRKEISREDIGTIQRVVYEVITHETVEEIIPIGTEPEPEPEPEPDFPAKTAEMFYYQHGDRPLPLWEYGTSPPTDGSLHLNVANSIDGNNDKPNSPAVGTDWQKYPGAEGGDAMHFWWGHRYGASAGTRVVFSRHGWKPTGLLPYKNQMIYGLIDFMAPALPIGAAGNSLWTTWPLEIKAHDPWNKATVQANVDSYGQLVWATGYANVKVLLSLPVKLVPGKLHRLAFEMGMWADPAKGHFRGTLDGVAVVEMTGQMAYPSGEWAGCATYIPCLYSNQLNARTDGYVPNQILSTAPIPMIPVG